MKPLSLGCQIIVHRPAGLVFDGGERRHIISKTFDMEGMKCTQEHCIG